MLKRTPTPTRIYGAAVFAEVLVLVVFTLNHYLFPRHCLYFVLQRRHTLRMRNSRRRKLKRTLRNYVALA